MFRKNKNERNSDALGLSDSVIEKIKENTGKARQGKAKKKMKFGRIWVKKKC